MIYKIKTYDGLEYEINAQQYSAIKNQLNTSKFIHLKDTDSTLAVASIKEIYTDYEAKNEREKEVTELLGGTVVGLLISGEVKTNNIELQLKFKKAWFEHIKRRPEIDRDMEKRRLEAHQHWVKASGISSSDRRYNPPPFLLSPLLSEEEKRIINTPIEKLMADYQISLTL